MSDAGPSGVPIVLLHEDADICLVEVTGDVDAHTCARFEQDAQEALTSSSRSIVMDLSGVGFIDSSGIRALLNLQSESQSSSKRLVLRNISPSIRRVLDLVGLADQFEIE